MVLQVGDPRLPVAKAPLADAKSASRPGHAQRIVGGERQGEGSAGPILPRAGRGRRTVQSEPSASLGSAVNGAIFAGINTRTRHSEPRILRQLSRRRLGGDGKRMAGAAGKLGGRWCGVSGRARGLGGRGLDGYSWLGRSTRRYDHLHN